MRTRRDANHASRPTEASIQRAICDLALYRGCLVVRINQGGMRAEYNGKTRWLWFSKWQTLGRDEQASGVSDLMIKPPAGDWLAVEVKKPGGKLRPSQRQFMAEVEARGGRFFVVDNVGEFEAILDEVSK